MEYLGGGCENKGHVLTDTEEMMRLNSIVVRVEDSGRISRNTWMETMIIQIGVRRVSLSTTSWCRICAKPEYLLPTWVSGWFVIGKILEWQSPERGNTDFAIVRTPR